MQSFTWLNFKLPHLRRKAQTTRIWHVWSICCPGLKAGLLSESLYLFSLQSNLFSWLLLQTSQWEKVRSNIVWILWEWNTTTKNDLAFHLVKCFWSCGNRQHCTDARKWRTQRYACAWTVTHHISTLMFRFCQTVISEGLISCSSNDRIIKYPRIWPIYVSISKGVLHFISFGAYPVHLSPA